MGLQFPPAIEGRYDVTNQDTHALVFVAWWLIILALAAVWLLWVFWRRQRTRAKRVDW